MEFRGGSDKNYVCDIDLRKVKPSRAGIIVYTTYRDRVLFCMGTDTATKDLTDFGGGINYKKDFDAVGGAIREFGEESLNVFGKLDRKDLNNCLAVYSDNIMIIFVRINVFPKVISSIFKERVKNEKNPEVSKLSWLTTDQLYQYIRNENVDGVSMYSKVRTLLFYAGNFGPYL